MGDMRKLPLGMAAEAAEARPFRAEVVEMPKVARALPAGMLKPAARQKKRRTGTICWPQ